jgi:TM2 domain-containing membrane protein YozV
LRERIVATVLSFIWPGLGQIYNRQLVKGLVLSVIMLVACAFFVLFADIPLSVVTVVLMPYMLLAAWDAYRTAAVRAFYRPFE